MRKFFIPCAVCLCLAGSIYGLYRFAMPETTSIAYTANNNITKETTVDETIQETSTVATESELSFTNHNRKSGELENLMFKIAEKTKIE